MDRILKEKIASIEKNILDSQKLITLKDVKIKILEEKTKDLKDCIDSLVGKVQKLEIKMESIHLRTMDTENKWTTITDFFVKIFWVVIVSYLLYKLGIQGPPA
jgi:hypothetical protein